MGWGTAVKASSTRGCRVRLLVAAGCLAFSVGAPVAASAQALYTGTPTPNAGSVDGGGPAPVAGAKALTVQAPSSGGLAFTGFDIAEFSVVGLGAILTGSVLVRRGRRTT